MPPTSTLRPRRSATVAAKVKKRRLRPGTKLFARPPALISLSRSAVGVGTADLVEQRQVEHVIVAEARSPSAESGCEGVAHVDPARPLGGLPLAVVEADRLDVGVVLERIGEADGRVLAAGKEHQGAARIASHAALPGRGRST